MRVMVTGHDGYIGRVLTPMLQAAGHDVVGLDSFLYEERGFEDDTVDVPAMRLDIRDVQLEHVQGFDAILHLAAISNDPLGNLKPAVTYEVNHLASVRLARLAKQAGVKRFLFSSSCSNYGAAGEDLLNEHAELNPVTPYGKSKVLVERDVKPMADSEFSPTFLRSATAYGVSSSLRADLVVNNLVGYAHTTGEVLIKSDGMPWRPLVHIEDISRAFLAVLHAPREAVHAEAFNVGRTEENYRVRQIADLVEEIVPESRVTYAADSSPDQRTYRVDCTKISETLGEYQPVWTVRKGIEELREVYDSRGWTREEFLSSKYFRIERVLELQSDGRLDAELRWGRSESKP